ncbi:MAG: hypothetical protein DRJ42_25905 [Deltaproteobacteria bacterium]|nr:MAG: hypothetical protein DRJ42_25905 [Deltaproteobacteria bacterium]
MNHAAPRLAALSLLSVLALLTVLASACEGGRSRPTPGDDSGISLVDSGTTGPDGSTPPSDGGMSVPDSGPPGSLQPGAACGCDSECAGTAANAGICIQGVCMTEATTACAEAGSRAECGAGARCWGLDGFDGGICWPDCDASSCAGSCDADGSCIPSETTSCDSTCCGGDGGGTTPGGECPPNAHVEGDGCVCDTGYTVNAAGTGCELPCTTASDCGGTDICVDNHCEAPPCTATSCATGLVCAASGDCVVDIGTAPPGTPPTACVIGSMDIPDWRCTSGCSDIVPFTPANGPGYDNYPLNGETASNQYRSFIRRDVMMLVKYATAMVACQTTGWSFGNGGDLGLGDMSEADGAIPGTSIGSPGHPDGTHVNGHDMDIGYYQVGTANNYLRPICEHMSGGVDQYHCVEEPHLLDPWRTSLFIAHLHINPNLRVIGIDGKAALLVESALTQLCSDGWVSTTACGSPKIAYELTDTGRFWFRFHHHHLHVSVNG